MSLIEDCFECGLAGEVVVEMGSVPTNPWYPDSARWLTTNRRCLRCGNRWWLDEVPRRGRKPAPPRGRHKDR